MNQLKFSIVFAWAFMWRLLIFVAIVLFLQMLGVRWFTTLISYSSYHLFLLSCCIWFSYFVPFVIVTYWMLTRGVMFKITQRYATEKPIIEAYQKKKRLWQRIIKLFGK